MLELLIPLLRLESLLPYKPCSDRIVSSSELDRYIFRDFKKLLAFLIHPLNVFSVLFDFLLYHGTCREDADRVCESGFNNGRKQTRLRKKGRAPMPDTTEQFIDDAERAILEGKSPIR